MPIHPILLVFTAAACVGAMLAQAPSPGSAGDAGKDARDVGSKADEEDRVHASHDAAAAGPAAEPALAGRIGATGILRLSAPAFAALTPREKLLAYWLSQAAIAIHPIIYDQLSPYGSELKRLLDGIAEKRELLPDQIRKPLMDYIQLVWINHGNYNNQTTAKFRPGFTPADLRAAAEVARSAGAWGGSKDDMDAMLRRLEHPIFDKRYHPRNLDKNPPAGTDILAASANNLYRGVTLADLEGFEMRHPLNSQLCKENGQLVERVYRAGTPDGTIPPGLYAAELRRAIRALEQAAAHAEPEQKQVIEDLIRYYQTGSPDDWHRFGVDWVQNNPTVDFANGFIEVYRDALGKKGSAQAYVTVTDPAMTTAMRRLADHAGYFEQRAPWAAEFKNPHPIPPVAKAVEAVIETGDFHASIIGENLPNEADIHARYGTKSFIFTGTMRAFEAALGSRLAGEFAYTPEELARAQKYGALQKQIFTAMHEVIGHGSGKLSPSLGGQAPAVFLKQYYSTLEEARADLVALWAFWDPKLIELGLIPSTEAAKAAYDAQARAALTQLREVPSGETIEEDHRRGTQLIVNYIRAKSGGIEPRTRDGKVYLVVSDYARAREGVGMLLAELMRIKATGDFAAIQDLVREYGMRFNLEWRDQVVARTQALDLPTYWGGLNPELRLEGGEVAMIDPDSFIEQQLAYARASR